MAIDRWLNIQQSGKTEILPDYWSTRKAARIGGVARFKLYGSPGTTEGRKRGGRNSCLLQQESRARGVITGFIVGKEIRIPHHGNDLAEAVGIILGDGSITRFQVSLAVSALVDREYSDYIVGLFERLFNIEVVRQKIVKNTIRLVLSSRRLVEFFLQMGLSIGDKIKNGVTIPQWILNEDEYFRSCLRGLFDTDGCVFYHHHFSREREYNHIGWEFTSWNEDVLNAAHNFLLRNHYRSKCKKGRVRLYYRPDLHRYFKDIGSSNPKHWKRYLKYFENIGEVQEPG